MAYGKIDPRIAAAADDAIAEAITRAGQSIEALARQVRTSDQRLQRELADIYARLDKLEGSQVTRQTIDPTK